MTAPLRIALIADHMVGHYRQSEAVAEAIREVRPIDMTRLTVRRRSPLRKRDFRPFLLRRSLHGALPLLVRGKWRGPFGLVLASSRRAITAALLIKRRDGAPVVYCTTPDDDADAADIDCVLVPHEHLAQRANHAAGPVAVRRFRTGGERKPFATLKGARIAVLIGGPSPGTGFAFAEDYCDALFARLTAIAAASPTTGWVVVTSRRTPRAAYPAIEAFCAGAPSCEFVDYRSAGPGSIARAQGCDAALVTEDSNSMITEFVLNGVATGVLEVPRTIAEPRQDYADTLKVRYRLTTFAPGKLTARALENGLKAARIETRDNHAELRERIGRYLPDIFAPPAALADDARRETGY